MKKIINKIGTVLGLVLSAPIKLPGKALNIIRYLALGLGIVESVINEDDQQDQTINEGKKDAAGSEDNDNRPRASEHDRQRISPAEKGVRNETD